MNKSARLRANLVVGLAGAAVAVLLAGCSSGAGGGVNVENETQVHRANAQEILNALAVQREQWDGYDRDKFPHWEDGANGCNTRSRVLTRDSKSRVQTARNGCTIVAGRWISPYDGMELTRADRIQIDHMVPLAEAWRSGARNWTQAQRTAYANDMGYRWALVSSSDRSNQDKGNSDPAKWMPPLKSFRCEYAKIWIAQKYRWNLSIDESERNALGKELRQCDNLNVDLPEKAI